MRKKNLLLVILMMFCLVGCSTLVQEKGQDVDEGVGDIVEEQSDALDADSVYEEYINGDSEKMVEDSGEVSAEEYEEEDWQAGLEEETKNPLEEDVLIEEELEVDE